MESTKSKKEPKHLIRDEFELEEIARALIEAKEENSVKIFSVYKREEPIKGTVIKMDTSTKLIHIQNEFMETHKVHFLDIISISGTEY
ncbi:hypothetical protein ABD87_14985 [Lysinibacillus sphaericus]|nr:hypothetical protein [Lysinibacillus sphaericus]